MSDFRFYLSFVFIGMAYMLILGIIMAPTEPTVAEIHEPATHQVSIADSTASLRCEMVADTSEGE